MQFFSDKASTLFPFMHLLKTGKDNFVATIMLCFC